MPGMLCPSGKRIVPTHCDALAPAAVAHVRPIDDTARRHKDDILQPVPGHIGELYAPIAELNIWEIGQVASRARFGAIPPLHAVIEVKLEAKTGSLRASVVPSPSRSINRACGSFSAKGGASAYWPNCQSLLCPIP